MASKPSRGLGHSFAQKTKHGFSDSLISLHNCNMCHKAKRSAEKRLMHLNSHTFRMENLHKILPIRETD